MLRLVLISLAVACASAFVCTPDMCMTVRCAAVTAENCAGTVVKNGGFCGCCDSCETSLGLGDTCASLLLLGPSLPAGAQCGKGLVCDPKTDTCRPEREVLFHHSKRAGFSCADRLRQIHQADSHGMPLLGRFIPQCETDGSYKARQCQGSVCYCVDPSGTTIQGYTGSISEAATMDCQCARDQYAYMQTGLIGKMFSCTSSGSYQRYQCTGSVCFCADHQGNMLTNSPTVNIGNIGALKC